MTGTWRSLSQKQRAVVQRLFDAHLTFESLRDPSAKPHAEERAVSFAELFAYANRRERATSNPLAGKFETDKRRASELRRLISKSAYYHAPRLAAASAGSLTHREGNGFTIDLRVSRAEPSQTYVVISFDSLVPDVPRALFVARQEERLIKHQLPTPRGNTIQLLLESKSDLIESLRDPDCEVFLR